jgi:hypothetical protein
MVNYLILQTRIHQGHLQHSGKASFNFIQIRRPMIQHSSAMAIRSLHNEFYALHVSSFLVEGFLVGVASSA